MLENKILLQLKYFLIEILLKVIVYTIRQAQSNHELVLWKEGTGLKSEGLGLCSYVIYNMGKTSCGIFNI